MNITLNANPDNAPCCIEIVADNGQSRLIQTDWDFPAIASTFGWDIQSVQVQNAGYYGVPCKHSGTDGTVKCQDCGLEPCTFIESARQWLDDNDGATADDPGYFADKNPIKS